MPERHDWTHEERLVAFYVYATEPFGRLHKGNPLIIRVAEQIGRTPSALAMKACNFASLDPTHAKRGVSGLGNVSQGDRDFWQAFMKDSDRVSEEVESAFQQLGIGADTEIHDYEGETETRRYVAVRRAQSFFRKTVLVTYGNTCAISGIAVSELLNASHIVPWRVGAEHRADPRNGIALNVLYDRAFDRGFFTIDKNLTVRVSSVLPKDTPLMDIDGKLLKVPERWAPLPDYLEYHRTAVFLK